MRVGPHHGIVGTLRGIKALTPPHVIYKPGRRTASLGPGLPATLISDIRDSTTARHKCLWFMALHLWYYVIVVWTPCDLCLAHSSLTPCDIQCLAHSIQQLLLFICCHSPQSQQTLFTNSQAHPCIHYVLHLHLFQHLHSPKSTLTEITIIPKKVKCGVTFL